jgi:nucleoside 2-deoxyribosyltransferase
MSDLPRIYLAGPDVFFPEPLRIAEARKTTLADYGLAGIFPLDNAVDPALSPAEMAAAIFRLNRDLIDSCHGVLANITPFRGASLDAGTAWEIGYACGRGKPVVAYTDDPALYPDKVHRTGWSAGAGDARDRNGHDIENFGLVDNLMITESVVAICASFEEAAASLRGFFRP